MASGVKVPDCVKELFKEMKVKKCNADKDDQIRLVIFKICMEKGEVLPAETFRERDLEGGDWFSFLWTKLNEGESCYALYDCHFETKESPKEDLVLVLWTPDSASIKEKMLYASSKEPLTKCLNGVKQDIKLEASDRGCRCEFVGKFKNVTPCKLEGRDL